MEGVPSAEISAVSRVDRGLRSGSGRIVDEEAGCILVIDHHPDRVPAGMIENAQHPMSLITAQHGEAPSLSTHSVANDETCCGR